MLVHLTNENFKEEVAQGKVLVDFYAEWCGPCKMLGPIIEEIAKEDESIKVIKVNVDEHESIAREYGVMSIPTIVLLQDGNLVKQNTGFMPKELLKNWYQ